MMNQCMLSISTGCIIAFSTQSSPKAFQEHHKIKGHYYKMENSSQAALNLKRVVGKSGREGPWGKLWWAKVAAASAPGWVKVKKLVSVTVCPHLFMYPSWLSSPELRLDKSGSKIPCSLWSIFPVHIPVQKASLLSLITVIFLSSWSSSPHYFGNER